MLLYQSLSRQSCQAARKLRYRHSVSGVLDQKEYLAPGDHYQQPDEPSSKYNISYTLPAIKLDQLPAKLSNFQAAKDFFGDLVLQGNKEQKDVYVDKNAFKVFEAVFPEMVESRNIGKLKEDDFSTWNYRDSPTEVILEKAFQIIDRDNNGTIDKDEFHSLMKRANIAMDGPLFDAIDKDGSGRINMEEFQEFWKKSNLGDESTNKLLESLQEFLENLAKPLVENNVEILHEPKDLKIDEHADFLCVGGPSTYAAALLHKAQYPDKSILHMVGHRFDSNADGSAYYYHERDAFPLYVNKVNTGWYCVYADLYKRFRTSKSLHDLCVKDRHHVKIAINWMGMILNPWMVFSIFIPNTFHAFMDLVVRKPKDSLMAQACLHSQRVPKVIDTACSALSLPTRAFLIRDPNRAVYIDVEGMKKANEHFDWLNQYAEIPYHYLDASVFSSLVTDVLSFNRDGALNPYMFENFYKAFKNVGGIKTQRDWFLDSIYVKPDETQNHRLVGTAALFKNCATGKSKTISFDSMTLSLGPSGAVVADPTLPENQGKGGSSSMRNIMNKINGVIARGKMGHKGTMWAAGSSSVALIGVKRGAASGDKLDTFRKFIDGVNQHWTLINERQVAVGDDIYDFFCLQMTGGGNFPSRYTKPDFVANLLYTTEAIFDLPNFKDGDMIYDIVQSRGCGRSVSSRNTVGFCPIAKNVVSAYGLGGIGMTTAFANGALQLQILEALVDKNGANDCVARASEGKIGNNEAIEKAKSFYGENIFEGVNYSAMIDDPQKVSRALGVDTTLSTKEKQSLTFIGGVTATVLGMLTMF